MTEEVTKIQEVFGQFAVDLGDGPVLFKTQPEAAKALSDYENGAEQRELAAAFCAHKGVDGKNAKGKSNIIVEFLAWVDAGQPGPAPSEEDGEAPAAENTTKSTEEVEF